MGRAEESRRPSRGAAASVALLACSSLLLTGAAVVAERPLVSSAEARAAAVGRGGTAPEIPEEPSALAALAGFFLDAHRQVWPNMEMGWKLILGSLIGLLGAALGSVGGVGGGGIFVPMFTLVLGFDPKSSAALSKCMIMGAAFSTVCYNFRMRHPAAEDQQQPVVDYDLALFFQPMMMLGISMGVAFNVIFPEWMVILLLVLLFLGTSIRALFKGIETWEKETIMKKEAARLSEAPSQIIDDPRLGYKPLPGCPTANVQIKASTAEEVPVLDNVRWKDLTLLLLVWVAFLALHIAMTFAKRCSMEYWILNALQVPTAVAVTFYEAMNLYKGKRTILLRGKQEISWKASQFLLYCLCGILAGIVGGLLGLGGGFILGPLFLELGAPPQVASATSTFAMMFSSSMSVIQYYLLDRFPVTYAAYFILLATGAALVGQHMVRKLIIQLGRASLIIFVLVITIFGSAIGLAVVGVATTIKKLEAEEYMGFENLCSH